MFINYKECLNSIVGELSQNTITLFLNSILIQAPINVLFYHHQIMRFRAKLLFLKTYFRFYLFKCIYFYLDFNHFIDTKHDKVLDSLRQFIFLSAFIYLFMYLSIPCSF